MRSERRVFCKSRAKIHAYRSNHIRQQPWFSLKSLQSKKLSFQPNTVNDCKRFTVKRKKNKWRIASICFNQRQTAEEQYLPWQICLLVVKVRNLFCHASGNRILSLSSKPTTNILCTWVVLYTYALPQIRLCHHQYINIFLKKFSCFRFFSVLKTCSILATVTLSLLLEEIGHHPQAL